MAATSKAELTALAAKEWAKLEALLVEIDEDLALVPHPVDGVTIKDTVIHRGHWIGLFIGWYEDGRAGRPVEIPAPGYKWNQLKDYNACVRAQSQDIPWPEATKRLRKAHDTFAALLASLDDTELYRTKPYGWTKTWTLGRYAEASGPSHYRSAVKYIREIRRKIA